MDRFPRAGWADPLGLPQSRRKLAVSPVFTANWDGQKE